MTRFRSKRRVNRLIVIAVTNDPITVDTTPVRKLTRSKVITEAL